MRGFLPAFFASVLCVACPSVPTDDDDATDVGPVPANAIEGTCGIDVLVSTESDPLDVTPVEGATYDCVDGVCTLALPPEVLTRPQPLLRASDDGLAFTGWEQGELVVARPGSVIQFTLDTNWTFAVDSEYAWLVEGGQILQVGLQGEVLRRCDLPATMTGPLGAVEAADGELFVLGINEEDGAARFWRATVDGWEPLLIETWPDRVVHHRGSSVFLLGYGYYEMLDLASLETQRLGGSDDDFSAVTVCEDGGYWVGGMTGMTLYCSAEHVCGERLDNYPFQATSYWCDGNNDLQFIQPNVTPTLATLTADDVLTTEPVPAGLRIQVGQAGALWRVIDGD